jgi:hypothetical protein
MVGVQLSTLLASGTVVTCIGKGLEEIPSPTVYRLEVAPPTITKLNVKAVSTGDRADTLPPVKEGVN